MACLNNYKVHTDSVRGVLVTLDSKYVVSYSSDKRIQLTRLCDGKINRTLSVVSISPCSIDLTPDNKYMLCNFFKKIEVVRLQDGKFVRTIDQFYPNVCAMDVCSTKDSKYVVSANGGLYTRDPAGTIEITRLDDGKLVRKIEVHSGICDRVSVTPDGKYVVSAVRDGSIQINSLTTGELIRKIKLKCLLGVPRTMFASNISVTRVYTTPNNKFVISTWADDNIRIFCLQTGLLVREIDAVGRAHCVTPDSTYFVTKKDNTVQITRLSTGKLINQVQISVQICSLCVSPDGLKIVAGCKDGSLFVLTTPKYMLIRQWSQIFLVHKQFKLFRDYPGLIRYLGGKLLLFC